MKKMIFAVVILITGLLNVTHPTSINAQAVNNKFGIHIIDENDLKDAAALVNSEGGEWGYVTMVIREDERDVVRWQRAMDELRRLKLIPLVRLATKPLGGNWEIPKEEEAVNWAGFLNSLNWPTRSRHVILFNEPNHAKEWGGIIDPAGYAKVAKYYTETLRSFSGDFFILPAGLDLAAPNGSQTMDAGTYFRKMHDEDSYIFTIFDGHTSHSYPNPGFSGSPNDTGRTSILGYKWEKELLESYGQRPDIGVFITETGWAESGEEVSEHYKYAYEHAWNDPSVIAVTPFVLTYKDAPFDQFSWRDPKTSSPRPQYNTVQSLKKIRGEPEQIHSFTYIGNNIAEYLVSDSEYSFTVEVKNTGQSIWLPEDGFLLAATSTMHNENIAIETMPYTEPGQVAKISVRLRTNEPRGIHTLNFKLLRGTFTIGEVLTTKFTLISPPSLNLFAKFWINSKVEDLATLTLYDEEKLIASYQNLMFVDGKATIPALTNVIPNRPYRFVLTKDYFLPAERSKTIYVGTVDIDFGRLLPFDMNNDGKLTLKDVGSYFANPSALFMRLYNL